ncbi:hypothetical protein QJQ45_014886 [Haematococcus lacustris]|nr:hypothetical protein QJQ45_014886 [Haematococcus lacustris]
MSDGDAQGNAATAMALATTELEYRVELLNKWDGDDLLRSVCCQTVQGGGVEHRREQLRGPLLLKVLAAWIDWPDTTAIAVCAPRRQLQSLGNCWVHKSDAVLVMHPGLAEEGCWEGWAHHKLQYST